MIDTCTRRDFLHVGTTAALISLSGCLFGTTGHIIFSSIEGRDWIEEGQTLRIVGRTGDTKAFEMSVKVPYRGDALTVRPATYSVSVYLEDEFIDKFEWDVTQCKNTLTIIFQDTKREGIMFATSSC